MLPSKVFPVRIRLRFSALRDRFCRNLAENPSGSTCNEVAFKDMLDSSSSTTAWTTGAVVRNRSDILYPADSESCSCKHAYCSLCSGSGSSGLVTARCSNSDVKRRYSSIFRDAGGCSCGLHGCVGGSLQPICFDVLTPGAPRYGFSAAEIRNVYEGVVE